MMLDADRLYRLLPEIYEAGADPELWPPALDSLTRYLGGTAAAVGAHDFGRRCGTIFRSVGYDPDCVRAYAERYAPHDPWLRRESAYRIAGRMFTGQEIVPDEELVRTGFYTEWLKPQDLHHRLCGVLRRDDGHALYISALRPSSGRPFGPDEAARLGLVLPHLRRAVQIDCRLGVLRAERDAARHALDRLSSGVLFVDGAGKVLAPNRQAQAILDRGDGLRLTPGGELQAASPDETRRLHRLIAAAGRFIGGAATAPPEDTLMLSRPPGRPPLQVAVSPVRGTSAPLGSRGAVAAIFVNGPEAPQDVDEERLCQLYGLNRVEARLAMQLVQGKTVEAAATAMRLTESTVRTYLKYIFNKTGVHRQAELVRLILIGRAQLRWD